MANSIIFLTSSLRILQKVAVTATAAVTDMTAAVVIVDSIDEVAASAAVTDMAIVADYMTAALLQLCCYNYYT